MTSHLNRRTLLKATGVAVALPWLDCMTTLGQTSANFHKSAGDVRRMLAMGAPLGIHTPYLFPKSAGRDYEVTPYLEPLQSLRQKFSVVSGLMHPDVDGGHSAEKSFLTGAAHPGQPSFQNTISVDQFAAEQIGHKTRFASLTLAADRSSLSYTRSGVQIPAETKPSRLFAKLFLDGTSEQKASQMRRIEDGQSVMDLVRDQTRQVARKVGQQDNQTLEQYLTSVRELNNVLFRQPNGLSCRNRPSIASLRLTSRIEPILRDACN